MAEVEINSNGETTQQTNPLVTEDFDEIVTSGNIEGEEVGVSSNTEQSSNVSIESDAVPPIPTPTSPPPKELLSTSSCAAVDPRGPYAGDAKLFVANLPFKTTEQELEELFSKYGEVSDVSINIDKLNGKSKGFGFVTMNDARDAADAVKALNHMEISGRELLVDVAHGGGSNTGVITRPKVYSRQKNRSRDHNDRDRDRDRLSPNDQSRKGSSGGSYDSNSDRHSGRRGDQDRNRKSRSRSRER